MDNELPPLSEHVVSGDILSGEPGDTLDFTKVTEPLTHLISNNSLVTGTGDYTPTAPRKNPSPEWLNLDFSRSPATGDVSGTIDGPDSIEVPNSLWTIDTLKASAADNTFYFGDNWFGELQLLLSGRKLSKELVGHTLTIDTSALVANPANRLVLDFNQYTRPLKFKFNPDGSVDIDADLGFLRSFVASKGIAAIKKVLELQAQYDEASSSGVAAVKLSLLNYFNKVVSGGGGGTSFLYLKNLSSDITATVTAPPTSKARAFVQPDLNGQTTTILFSGKVEPGETWQLNVAEANARFDRSNPDQLLLKVGKGLSRYKVSDGTSSVLISAHVSAAEIKTELEKLPGVGVGHVTVTAVNGTLKDFLVEFHGLATRPALDHPAHVNEHVFVHGSGARSGKLHAGPGEGNQRSHFRRCQQKYFADIRVASGNSGCGLSRSGGCSGRSDGR